MAKTIDRGKTAQIISFIRQFTAENGFSPTMREIAAGVGLKSTSTVFDYISRMEKKGLVTSTPCKQRSLRVVEPKLTEDLSAGGGSVLNCRFVFPEGSFPVGVIAMVSDGKSTQMMAIPAERIEVVRAEPHPHADKG